ncbi:MAG: diphthamide biosynthesis enzyme Dph2 [Candidatus Diapherotrites archaeon]|nr:diphthamide biosynthesis enzyme Dph2 [Candidatus Diapherotrites archaeon]
MVKIEFGLGKAIEAIRRKKAKLVVLQVPEGLKPKTREIAKEIEQKTGAKTITLVQPCYGACDIPLGEAKALGADLAIHFGHTAFLKSKNIVYVPLHYPLRKPLLKKLVKAFSKKIEGRQYWKIGLVSTAQFLGWLPEAKKLLELEGFRVFIGKAPSMQKGQVLGCNTIAAQNVSGKADCLVFVGDGRFHPLGIAYRTRKAVFMLNPLAGSVSEIEHPEVEKLERGHIARIEIARQAKSFGILVSTKPGQMNIRKALELKALAEKKRKKALILVSDEIREEFVLGLDLECFVNTACPRLVLDDAVHWKRHLVSAEEMQEAMQ